MFFLHRVKQRLQRLLLIGTMGTVFIPWPGCDIGEVSAGVTLDGRVVIASLIKSAILGPIELWIDSGVDYVIDRVDPEE